MRRICYISGTRADFGLMRSTLKQIASTPGLSLGVVATGMHLDPAYGSTINEIRNAGLDVVAEIPVLTQPATGATMARNIGTMIGAMVAALEIDRPDIVLLLGDRGEMLAGAVAAIHLNIAVAHIHGGERSGTVDEPVRHAISKLAHIHLVSTQDAANRLIQMGERPDCVHITGAPGLDGLADTPVTDKTALQKRFDLASDLPLALMVYHPVLQEAERAEADTTMIVDALRAANCATVALMPNSDAGSDGVRKALQATQQDDRFQLVTHLERTAFINLMAHADLMIGNSSAGIIEAASFGTPVINIGIRQNLRDRNANVADVPADADAVAAAILKSLASPRFPANNIYGNGQAGERIVRHLSTIQLGQQLVMKVNSY
jgi:GDP/UDP-N,N'-diacetylbacillosamine 2-epimerase (hydrolysing)